MILFVDETENVDHFILTGLLVNSREEINLAYKRFKNKVIDTPISNREKAVLFTEYKSILLDRRYKRIKIKMLEELGKIHPMIIYSCHIKKGASFSQKVKEDTYIVLLSKIVSSIEAYISVIFDAFNKTDFERRIVERIIDYQNVQAISPVDSQKEPGLQFVDNICSVIRMHASNSDQYGFYQIIEKWIKSV